jgi:acetoacetyl-CoA synthetase
MSTPPILWKPDADTQAHANLSAYQQWLREQRRLYFTTYDELWQWSIEQPEAFWQSIWDYFEVISHEPYRYVQSSDPMPYTQWFAGSRLNYAEHIFRMENSERPAIRFQSERHPLREISWQELRGQVAAFATYLRQQGVGPGDRVVAYLPNIPAATVAWLAACSLGAVWSSASPDFGADSVIERFAQIEPKVLIAVDGYQYGGKPYDRRDTVRDMVAQLPTLQRTVLIPYLDEEAGAFVSGADTWSRALGTPAEPLSFVPLPFEHPIWVLYSSGTTGAPKAITHSHGGMLVEHLKYLAFHNDVKVGENFFWFSTTGWMMWNYVQAALLHGATIVLYDGSPGYPSLDVLWELAEKAPLHHFGSSAPFIVACMKRGLSPKAKFDLSTLRSLSSTGAPLPPEGFAYLHHKVKKDLWLVSMSGGTDVCTAFVGGVPTVPVYQGEIQRRALGCDIKSLDEAGKPLIEEVGEMVITQPMPSMPIYFWNDPKYERYLDSYFDTYPGQWRHGDWLQITKRNTLVILGRSDATLNRQGVRIGTAEIYRAVDQIAGIADSLIVNLELPHGDHYMPLFVQLAEGQALDQALIDEVKQTLRHTYSPRHVPDELVEVSQIPYTISGKKLEAPVKKILMGRPVEQVANSGSMRNPEALDFFVQFRAQRLVN